ncbi:hypothetical protein B0H21DRAFT_883022 [Amylocystis lapponica]|nr:hypothetical protein B0H21DRAFT_883022 [Amylocystis lapponica]
MSTVIGLQAYLSTKGRAPELAETRGRGGEGPQSGLNGILLGNCASVCVRAQAMCMTPMPLVDQMAGTTGDMSVLRHLVESSRGIGWNLLTPVTPVAPEQTGGDPHIQSTLRATAALLFERISTARELEHLYNVPSESLSTFPYCTADGKRRRSVTLSKVSDNEMDNVEDDELGYLDLPPTSAPRSTAMQEIPMPPIPLDTSYSTVAFAESPLVPRLVDATRAAAQDEASATSRPFLDDSLIDPQLLRQAIPAPSSEKASGQSNESEP